MTRASQVGSNEFRHPCFFFCWFIIREHMLRTMGLVGDSESIMARKRLSELARLIQRSARIFVNYRTVLAELEKRGIFRRHVDDTYSLCQR